jgi:Protein of unknown function (DUF2949)
MQAQFIRFLQEDMEIGAAEIAIAQRLLEKLIPQQSVQDSNLLATILWQYGLVNLKQLDRMFDWLETA